MEYYFAYGSNLSVKQMGTRGCRVLGKPLKGILKGYRLSFTQRSAYWRGGVADIVKGKNHESVKGVIYPIADISSMDSHEGCRWENKKESEYYRKLLHIQTGKGKIKAWVYYMVKGRRESDFVQPSLKYVKQMVNGRGKNDGGLRGFGFSEEVVKEVCQIARIEYNKV